MILGHEKSTAHLEFLQNDLMFEIYDEVTKNKIYSFYDQYSNVECYLPKNLQDNNDLEYVIQIIDENNTRKLVKVKLEKAITDFEVIDLANFRKSKDK